mgnify:CR=1 FL=1
MFSYSEKVMKYFLEPKFYGSLENPDAIGEYGDVECGDYLLVSIAVKDGAISEIRYKCFGCPAAIASSEAMCELAIGKSLGEAVAITDEDVAKHLFGLPEQKLHCSNLGAAALKMAIEKYERNPA